MRLDHPLDRVTLIRWKDRYHLVHVDGLAVDIPPARTSTSANGDPTELTKEGPASAHPSTPALTSEMLD